MTQAQQPEALRLAAICEAKGMFPVADELNRMHARILELEQGKCLHQIAEPAQRPDAHAKAAIATLTSLGYTWIGGELWKSPIGKAPDFNLLDAMHARIAELESQLEAIGAGGVEPLRKPASQQAVQAAVPDGWVPCVITYEGQHPEEIAYGPQVMMDRLKKWLDRYFEMRTAPAHPAEGVPAPFSASGIAPCPLCGSASKHVKLGEDRGHRILCWNDDCECSSGYFSSKEDAIASWNSRAALAATQPAAQGLDPDSVVRHLAIGRAIERVCVELPEGAEISISLEKGAGTITLIDWDGNEQENFPTDDGFAGTLNAAVDTAIADEAALAAQAKQGGA